MSEMLTSRIAELHGPHDLQFREETLDISTLASNEIACKTVVSVLSPGTEVAAWRGDPPLRPMKVYPRVVGYCNVARVVATGAELTSLRRGDLVLNYQSHRSAFITPVEKVAAVLQPGDNPVRAAATYLFHLGYNALLKGDFRPGMNVAVVGLGTLGLGAVSLAAGGGGRVVGFSNVSDFRDRAKSFGALGAVSKDVKDAQELVREHFGTTGVDLVISTSNTWSDWHLALEIARRESTIAVLGFPGRGQEAPDFNPLDSQYFYDKQLRLIACGFSPDHKAAVHEQRFTLSRNMEYLLDQIRRNRLPAGGLIQEVLPWDQLAEAYRILERRELPVLTYALRWEELDA